MAPRILHFGLHQLYWECHQYDACETYTRGLPQFKLPVPQLLDFKRRNQRLNLNRDLSGLHL
jgi:hypothetical protein